MDDGSNVASGSHVLPRNNWGLNVNKGPDCRLFSAANVNLFEQFIVFCKSRDFPTGLSSFCPVEDRADGDSSLFRKDLITYFGDKLIENVVNDVCKLVQENSYGKCMSCVMPVERLILRVLQILCDGGQIVNGFKKKNCHNGLNNSKDIHPIPAAEALPKHACRVRTILQPSNITGFQNEGRTGAPKRSSFSEIGSPLKENINPNVLVNVKNNSCASFGKDTNHNMCYNGRPNYSLQNHARFSGDMSLQPSISTSLNNLNHELQQSTTHRQCSDFSIGNGMNNPILILDTPLVMHQGSRSNDEPSSMRVTPHSKYKKVRIEGPNNDRLDGGNVICKRAATVDDRVSNIKGPDDVQVLNARSFRDRRL